MDKRKLNDQSPVAYTDALTKKIVSELKQHYEYFTRFDKIRALIKHEPMPKAPKWHFWVSKENRRDA